MLKCPNCGSTAQFRHTTSVQQENKVTNVYHCGCGCIAQEVSVIQYINYYTKNGEFIKKDLTVD